MAECAIHPFIKLCLIAPVKGAATARPFIKLCLIAPVKGAATGKVIHPTFHSSIETYSVLYGIPSIVLPSVGTAGWTMPGPSTP